MDHRAHVKRTISRPRLKGATMEGILSNGKLDGDFWNVGRSLLAKPRLGKWEYKSNAASEA